MYVCIAENFNTFYFNVNSLDSKFDALHTLLSNASLSMDAIAINETSELEDQSFFTNMSLEGYELFKALTLSYKGGVALYMKNKFSSFEKVDLRAQTSDYEGMWVELKNFKSRNIVCGCVYKHQWWY